jgi:hypothetical protein
MLWQKCLKVFAVESGSAVGNLTEISLVLPMPFHPSPHLNYLFGRQPFQGCNPYLARFIFTGEDANFAPNIESQRIWQRLAEYLTDGLAFWNHHGVHHPFLLEDYDGQGTVYHRHYHAIFNHEEGNPKGAVATLPENIRQNIVSVR